MVNNLHNKLAKPLNYGIRSVYRELHCTYSVRKNVVSKYYVWLSKAIMGRIKRRMLTEEYPMSIEPNSMHITGKQQRLEIQANYIHSDALRKQQRLL